MSIEPKKPDGVDPEALWMQWAHDEIKRLTPIRITGQRMGKSTQGDYLIGSEKPTTQNPPAVRISDNLLHYLFDHYEMQNTVYDGVMIQDPWPGFGRKGRSSSYIRRFADLDNFTFIIHLGIKHNALTVYKETVGTSTTSLTVATGTVTFTTQPGLVFGAGPRVRITSTADASNWMEGDEISYNSSTGVLSVNVDTTHGSGTVANWNISISDLPFYTGSRGSLLGDYTGDITNPVDPVTITKAPLFPTPTLLAGVNFLSHWLVQMDGAFMTWARATGIYLSALPQTIGFTDPAAITGLTGYGDWDFGVSDSTVSFGVLLTHLAPISGGPSNWYFEVFAPGVSASYIRDAGDGPVPYGTYSLTAGHPSPPATLTISPASDNAPG